MQECQQQLELIVEADQSRRGGNVCGCMCGLRIALVLTALGQMQQCSKGRRRHHVCEHLATCGSRPRPITSSCLCVLTIFSCSQGTLMLLLQQHQLR
jgi:hypothetical protein